jgi:hypothetical protein
MWKLTLRELTSQEQLGPFDDGQLDARRLPPSGVKKFRRSLSINLVPLTSPGRMDCCASTAIAAALNRHRSRLPMSPTRLFRMGEHSNGRH